MSGTTVPYARSSSPQHAHQYQTRSIHGQIMWLPSKKQLSIETGIEDECHNHPVVILSPEPSNGEVVILLITSFNGVDLKVKHRRNKQARLAHLPIKPCPPHPDNGLLLALQDKQVLGKNSYVKIEKQYTISLSVLRRYYNRSQKRCILTEASYKKLIQHAEFTPITSPNVSLYLDDLDNFPRLGPSTSQPHNAQLALLGKVWNGSPAAKERLNRSRSYGTSVGTTRLHHPSGSQGYYKNGRIFALRKVGQTRAANPLGHVQCSQSGSSSNTHTGPSVSSGDTGQGMIATVLISQMAVAGHEHWAVRAIKLAKDGMKSVWRWIKAIPGMLRKVWNWAYGTG